MNTPRPQRDRVVLASEGFPGQVRFTVHHFIGAVPIAIRGETYWSFQYKCFETGAERRFGLADRTALSEDEIKRVIAEEGN